MTREADETIVARMVVDEMTTGAKQVAHLQGPAPGMTDVKGQEEAAMWNYRDPSVTPEALAQMYTQALSEGYEHEDALGLITFKAYPNRGPILLNVSDNPKEQAAYARKMKQRSAGTQPDTAIEITPEPTQPEAGGY